MKVNRGSSKSTISIAISLNFQQFQYKTGEKSQGAEELGPEEEDVGPGICR